MLGVFEELIKNAKFNYIFLIINNEGLMAAQKIRQIMKRYGKYVFLLFRISCLSAIITKIEIIKLQQLKNTYTS